MPNAYQSLAVTPADGGDLITRASGENVGATNYTDKLDFRRVLDGEVRRGGTVVFAPNGAVSELSQYYIGGPETINLIHNARKPNGKTAVIAGSESNLWRYFSFEDGNVYVADPLGAQVYDDGVYEDVSGVWLLIGTNFSNTNRKWEAVDVGGKTVFNNGTDLPVVYDLDWLKVKPLYELREQGIAAVETIENYNGYLVTGNVIELTPAGLDEVMNGRSSGLTTISQTAFVATASSAFFTSDDVGKTLLWPTLAPYGGKIVGFTNSTTVTLDTSNNVPATNFAKVATQYGTVVLEESGRTQYRLLWSAYDDPENFGSASPVTGAAGSYTVNLPRSMASLKVGDEVIVTGGGVAGSDLATTVFALAAPNYTVVTLADPLVTAVTTDVNVIYKSVAVGSAAGSVDLQDSGSAILRIVELQGRMIVLKEDSIFSGITTGVAAAPFQFNKIYSGPKSLFYRWSVAKIDNQYLLFGGRYSFYSFDPSNTAPKEHEKLELCKNLFDQTNTPDNNVAYVSPLTQEVIFFNVASVPNNRVCYDYVYNTVSTSSLAVTAGAAVYVPDGGTSTVGREVITVMALGTGQLVIASDTVFTRQDFFTGDPVTTPYDSVLRGGLVSFGDEFNEKDLRSYVLYFGGATPPSVQLKLYGTRNAHETPVELFTRTITTPGYKNLVNCFYRKNYFQDQLTITGATTGAKLVRRLFEAAGTDSRSTIRTP